MKLLIYGIIVFLFIYFFKHYQVRKAKRLKDITYEINEFNQQISNLKKDYITYIDRNKMINKHRILYNKPDTKFFKDKPIVNEFINKYVSLENLLKKWNEEFVVQELKENKGMFDNIDEKSLDDQQRRAVVVDEMNNLVLAGAGSGKTLTISAKVKYLVDRKNINPNDILLISFTRKAADEMTERISKGLNMNVEAKTFHKVGLDIIANNRGRRPDVAEEDLLSKIIYNYFNKEILKDRAKVSQLLTFFGYYFYIPKDFSEFKTLGDRSDFYRRIDFETVKGKFDKDEFIEEEIKIQRGNKQTIKGETVKSLEELIIANFLYLNGIEYIYEHKYPFESEDKFRKAYRPDFYLTEYDIYLEHFGITEDFKTPWLSRIEEEKYLDGITWKRNFHNKNETKLIETYSYYNKNGLLLVELERILKEEKVKFKNVNIEKIYNKILENKEKNYFRESTKLFSTFIGLFKSNGYSIEQFSIFKDEIDKYDNVFLKDRATLFLDVIKPIYMEYEKYLKKNKLIDFNDMINMARDIVEKDNLKFSYKYIIIDEYQDISVSRFKLIKAIRDRSYSKVMCVGDDWQSIYRFAGSDIELFTSFEKQFGYYELLKIENTYRNSQELINIAGKFVMQNEHQLKKDLKSSKKHSNPLRLFTYDGMPSIALKKAIGEIVSSYGENAQITILGRNNFDIDRIERSNEKEDVGDKYKEFKVIEKDNEKKVIYKKYPRLDMSYLTVHRSKGLEGHNVIVINLENSSYGFPNSVSDDPILSLVLTKLDDYEFAEERRLFYVALTRTKNITYLISPVYKQSIFCDELVSEFNMKYEPSDQTISITQNPNCPKCEKGYLVVRKNVEDRDFLGCTNYPYCDYSSRHLEIINDQIRCSSCNGYMVKRVGPYSEFYGCTNYPLCKNTLNIEVPTSKIIEKETNKYIKQNEPIKDIEINKYSEYIKENQRENEIIFDMDSFGQYDEIEDFKFDEPTHEIKMDNKEYIDKKSESIKDLIGKSRFDIEDYIGKEKINLSKEEIFNKGTYIFNDLLDFGKEAIKQADEKLKEIDIAENINKIKKVTKNIVNKVDEDDFLGVDSRVSHVVFGEGIVVSNDGVIIRVDFKKDGIISFSYETCKKDKILRPINTINNLSIENLIEKSDYYYKNRIFSEDALLVNKDIVDSGCKITKYQLRLADCYKKLNMIEEALVIYEKIASGDKKSNIALDNLVVYGKGIYQKYQDKPYGGEYRDVGTPPIDEDGTF